MSTPLSPLNACSREMLLLIAAGRKQRAPVASRIHDLIAEPLDWRFLLQAADYHGLAPLLWFHLQPFATELPGEFAEELRAAAMVVTRSNLRLISEIARLLPALGPGALPYKGPLLADYLYGNIGLRPAVDLDIIVPRCEARKALEVLEKLGYKIDPPLRGAQLDSALRWSYELAFKQSDVALDLHWDIAARGISATIAFEEVRERSKRKVIAGVDVLWPSPEDQLLLLAVHAGKHFWRKLAWLADIAELSRREPELDWEMATERSRVAGCLRMMLATLKLACELFEAELPQKLRKRLDKDRKIGAVATDAMASMFAMTDPTLSRARHFAMLRLRERWPDKLRYALSIVFEPQLGDHTAVALPAGTSRLYPFIRVLRLIGFMGGPEKRRAA